MWKLKAHQVLSERMRKHDPVIPSPFTGKRDVDTQSVTSIDSSLTVSSVSEQVYNTIFFILKTVLGL